jgi:hypothetical protein
VRRIERARQQPTGTKTVGNHGEVRLRFSKHIPMRVLLSCEDSTGSGCTARETVIPLRVWAELIAMRVDSLSYLAGHLEQLARLLRELPEGSLTADELRTLRELVQKLKRSLS